MRRFLDRKVIGAVLAGALVLSTVPVLPINNISVIHADDADEIAEAEEKISSARVKKQAAEEKLAQLEANKEDLLDVIEKLDNEITGYEQKIAALTEERNALQAKASIAESDLQNAYVAEAIQYESMKERIQFAYENGDTTYLNALISVKDYSNVNNQAEYVSQVSTYDQTQLNALLEIEQTIASYEVEINDNLTAIEDLKTEAEGEQEALQVMQDGKQETLAEYNQEISETEYSIEQLEALEVEQDNVIAAIEAAAAQRRAAAEAAAAEAASQAAAQKAAEEAAAQAAAQKAAEEEAARKAAAEAAAQAAAQNADTASATDATPVEYTETTDTTSTTDTTATTTTDTTSYTTTTTTTTTTTDTSTAMATYSGGGFTWPMPSSYTITSPFGYREIDVEGATSNHRGVDISCPTGSSVVAAADGVVSYVGYLGTAGNAVLIDHGNGITTMYYHLSAFNTSVGANVYAGQTIAYSGSTGASSGPHLHFGVRINGAYVDPMGYF